MLSVFWEVIPLLLLFFLLGWLVMGWLTWRWRRADVSTVEWEALSSRAAHADRLEVVCGELEVKAAGTRAQAEELHRLLSVSDERANNFQADLFRARQRADSLETELAEAQQLSADLAQRLDIEERRSSLLVEELAGARNQSTDRESGFEGFASLRADHEDLSARLDDAESELAVARGGVAELATRLAASQNRVSSTEGELAEAQDRIDALEGELAAARHDLGEVDHLQARIAELEAQVTTANDLSMSLEADLEAARQQVIDTDGLRTRVGELSEQLSAAEGRATSLQRQVVEAEGDAQNHRAEVDGLRAAFPGDDGSWRKATTKLGTPGADHTDDLKAIKGVGPKMERLLQSFGIQTWEQVAALTEDDVDIVDGALGEFSGRIRRDDWVAQAQALLATRHDAGGASAETNRQRSGEPQPVAAKPTKSRRVTGWENGTTKLGTPGVGHQDDLKVIHGIGPKMESVLNGLGIQAWEQLAAFRKDDVAKVADALETFPGRIERDEWVSQAKELVRRFPDHGDRPTRATYLNRSADTDSQD